MSRKIRSNSTPAYFYFVLIILAAAVLIMPQEAGLKKFSSEQELKAFLKSSADPGYAQAAQVTRAATGDTAGAEVSAAPKSGADYSGTNIQVQGVDEADIVKTDGRYIYSVSGSNIAVIEAYPAENAALASVINLTGRSVSELYINGNKLVVFGSRQDYYGFPVPHAEAGAGAAAEKAMIMPSPTVIWPYFPNSFVSIYDVSDKANPKLEKSMDFNGTYFDSRMIGDHVYTIMISYPGYNGDDIVVPAFSPVQRSMEIYYPDSPGPYEFVNIVSINVNDPEQVQNKVFLLGSTSALYVSKDNIYMVHRKPVRADFSGRFTDVIIENVPAEVAAKMKEIRDSGKPDYQKTDEINRLLGEWLNSLGPDQAAQALARIEQKYAELQKQIAKEIDRSVVHKIAISGGIEYKTKAEVPGHPLNQFSMDEHNGYFRIATTTDFGFLPMLRAAGGGGFGVAEAAVAKVSANEAEIAAERIIAPRPAESANHLYVLDSGMNVAGKIEDLAPGERIYSARFAGDRAYLVTFVRIDPLFVIDLKDPADPKVLGELKIPGVSDYLHPYDEKHLIGVGRFSEGNGFRGLKLSLFNVENPEKPQEIASFQIEGADSEALHDHKAFLFSKDKQLLVIPAFVYNYKQQVPWQGAYVFDSNLKLKGTVTHSENMTEGFYYPVNQVRRSLYIGDVLYTISDQMMKANSLDGLEEISKVDLTGYKYDVIPKPLAETRAGVPER